MKIAVHFTLPTLAAAKVTGKISSELLGDPNEEMGRDIRGAKASKVFIKTFPKFLESLAFP